MDQIHTVIPHCQICRRVEGDGQPVDRPSLGIGEFWLPRGLPLGVRFFFESQCHNRGFQNQVIKMGGLNTSALLQPD